MSTSALEKGYGAVGAAASGEEAKPKASSWRRTLVVLAAGVVIIGAVAVATKSSNLGSPTVELANNYMTPGQASPNTHPYRYAGQDQVDALEEKIKDLTTVKKCENLGGEYSHFYKYCSFWCNSANKGFQMKDIMIGQKWGCGIQKNTATVHQSRKDQIGHECDCTGCNGC